jgi:hypothetical protein
MTYFQRLQFVRKEIVGVVVVVMLGVRRYFLEERNLREVMGPVFILSP